jgi:predicted RNA-binding Zn-ribbon protein involved in translation (DUF1610 family)
MNIYDLHCPDCGYTQHDIVTSYITTYNCPLCDSSLIKYCNKHGDYLHNQQAKNNHESNTT